MSFRPDNSIGASQHGSSNSTDVSRVEPQQQQQQTQPQMSFRPDTSQELGSANAAFNSDGMNPGGNTSSMSSFSPSGPGMGGPMGGMGGQMGSSMGMGGMGGPMSMMSGMGPMGMMGMGAMGMAGMGPMAFQAMLQQSMLGQHQAQIAILLPADLIQQALIPDGHLSQIAQTCSISIDLGAEISGMRQVSLAGTVAANAMAIYFLQERSLQYTGGKMM